MAKINQLDKEIEIFVRFLKKEKYSDRVIVYYRKHIEGLSIYAGKNPNLIKRAEIEKYYSILKKKNFSDSTLGSYVKAVKLFYEKKFGKGSMNYIKRPSKDYLKPVDYLSKSEIQQLLTATKKIKKLKTIAILNLIYYAGMKISEVASLKWKDIQLKKGIINIDSKVLVPRTIKIEPQLYSALIAYLEDEKIKKSKEWVFIGSNTAKGKHVTERNIERTIFDLKDISKIKSKLNAHIIRHSRAIHLKESGKTFREIQAFLGIKASSSLKYYKNVFLSRNKKLKK